MITPKHRKNEARGRSVVSRTADMSLAIAAILLALTGCRDSTSNPPHETAPRQNRMDSGRVETDDDQDEPARRTRPTWHKQPSPAADTINGHPKGPKADSFNAVVRSAYARANACFASRIQHLGKGPFTMKVRITVGNDGKVRQAQVTEGVKDTQVRTCVLDLFRSLRFPAYQGPEVSQVVPFTVVRAQ